MKVVGGVRRSATSAPIPLALRRSTLDDFIFNMIVESDLAVAGEAAAAWEEADGVGRFACGRFSNVRMLFRNCSRCYQPESRNGALRRNVMSSHSGEIAVDMMARPH